MWLIGGNKLDKYRYTENKCLEKRKFNHKSNIIFLAFFLLFFIAFSTSAVLKVFGGLKAEFYGNVIGYTFLSIFFLTTGVVTLVVSTYDNKLSTKTLGFLFIIFTAIPAIYLPNYYKDLPKVLNSDYSCYEGELTDYYVAYGKFTHTHLTIGNEKFNMKCKPSAKNPPIKGRMYSVEYLPNTKFVVNFYKK